MKILQIIRSLDSNYQDTSQSFCSYFLEALGANDDFSKLTAISSGMVKVLNTELSHEDRHLAELFLSSVNSLSSILGIICTSDDPTQVMYNWFKKQIEAKDLESFSRELNDFKSLYTPPILIVMKECLLKTAVLGYVPFVKVTATGVTRYSGILQNYSNKVGMDNIGFCFTTSKENLVGCISRKKYPSSPFYPFVVSKNSKLYDKNMGSTDCTLREAALGIEVPLIVKNK